jgi:hypothetical protein
MKTATKKTAANNKPIPKHRAVILTGENRTHKKCSICKKNQPLEQYYRPQKDCRCKGCGKIYAAQLRERKLAEAEAANKKPAKKAVKK